MAIVGGVFGGFAYRIRTIKRHKRELERLVHQRTEELAREKEKVEQQNETLLHIQNEILAQNEEIRKQRDDIQAMSERIHRADQEKLDFFTNISHEIRTPLTLIISPLEKVLHTLTEDHFLHRQLSVVHRNAQKLVLLVNQMLDFRKMENNGYKLRAARFELKQVLQQIMSDFADQASRQKIDFRLESTHPTLEVWLDYEKFDKIISNLLSNAFKFTPAGGSILVKTNVVGDSPETQCAVVTIADDGVGIPADQLHKIFEAFYQADNANNLQTGGTGIGLAIAKSLTELHHGTIEVQNKEGQGTQFEITLPLGSAHLTADEMIENPSFIYENMPVSAMPTEAIALQEANKSTAKDRRDIVLIVEDNADLREYLRECLKPAYKVLEAANGQTGLAEAEKIQPHLIISDIMMPEMDGLELCKRIKTNLHTSHIPVVLLTAKSTQAHKIEGLATGADDYISKPFDVRELQIRVANLIQSRKLLRKQFSQNITLDPQEITLTSADAEFLQNALAVVENHLSDADFSVADFVKHMGVSRSLLHLKLKELTDQSASDFVRSIRLKRAAHLLAQHQRTVAEIAYMVGFNDPKYFHKCFKERYGTTPGNFAAATAPEQE